MRPLCAAAAGRLLPIARQQLFERSLNCATGALSQTLFRRRFHSSNQRNANEKTNGNEQQGGQQQQYTKFFSGFWKKKWQRWAAVGLGTVPAPLAMAAAVRQVQEDKVQAGKAPDADHSHHSDIDARTGLPIILHEEVFAPNVPPPVNRRSAALVRVKMRSEVTDIQVSPRFKYHGWSFNGKIPGPFLRVRVGDTLEVIHENLDTSGMQHNIDFHAVMGSGGGAPLLNADSETECTARFKMLYPGLYVYHCAAGPLPMHIANGMYGLILVEPEEGLPKVDREFYVMQSEFYVDQSTVKDEGVASFDYESGMKAQPELVVFNGREGALTHGNVLQARINDRVRFYFGNIGPNLISTFHVIGAIFEKAYRDGSVVDTPAKYVQNVLVGPGSACVAEFTPQVPGTYTLIDHAIFRTDQGAVGFLNVKGAQQPHIYSATHTPNPCPNCKLHP